MDLKMLPIITVDNNCYDPILGSTYKVIQSTHTLKRITQLNDSLAGLKLMRSKAISALHILGTIAKKELSLDQISFDEVKMKVKKGLSEIKTGVKINKSLLEIYEKAIDASENPKQLDKCFSKLLKDTSSITTFNLQKTNNGQNGPTHIISYTRTSKKCLLPQLRNYVVKWSNWNEICSWRLYDVISKSLHMKTIELSKIAALDFKRLIHEKGDWVSESLEETISTDLKQLFIDILGRSIQTTDAQLMLMEKVKGSNLIDFAQTKYQYLDIEEKCDLFQKMGHLAMLDLLIGNTDRLIQTRYDANAKQYLLENITANLGNLMIDWFPDEDRFPLLYAIDNGIKTELITDVTQKDAYNKFIRNQFEDANMKADLADTIIGSIKNSFQDNAEVLAESSKESLTETLAKFDPILKDLQNSDVLKNALVKGLEEMSWKLKEDLLPFWNNNEALKLKRHLNDNFPTLLEAVSERFQIFNSKG